MTGSQLLDWFAEPKDAGKDIAPDPKLKVKDLYPVSLRARVDFNRGVSFGKLVKTTNFQFKYPSWGLYPIGELLELEALTITMFAIQDKEAWDLRHITNVLQPEQSKEVQKIAIDLTQGLIGIYKGRPKA
jgi:hypothetical protein